jgi:hypothetical protein
VRSTTRPARVAAWYLSGYGVAGEMDAMASVRPAASGARAIMIFEKTYRTQLCCETVVITI